MSFNFSSLWCFWLWTWSVQGVTVKPLSTCWRYSSSNSNLIERCVMCVCGCVGEGVVRGVTVNPSLMCGWYSSSNSNLMGSCVMWVCVWGDDEKKPCYHYNSRTVLLLSSLPSPLLLPWSLNRMWVMWWSVVGRGRCTCSTFAFSTSSCPGRNAEERTLRWVCVGEDSKVSVYRRGL